MSLLARLRAFGIRRAPAPRGEEPRDTSAPRSAIVLCEGAPPFQVARTERALARLGATAVRAKDGASLAAALGSGERWIVRAGAFDLAPPPVVAPSATGRPVAAIGAPLAAPPPCLEAPEEVALAETMLGATGGDLSERAAAGEGLPFVSLVLDAPLAELVARAAEGLAPGPAITEALARSSARVVRLPALDAPVAAEVRVAQLVTSLQIGGAERVARDLARGLARTGTSARLFALGRPTRARWAPLPHEVDLGSSGLGPAARIQRLLLELDVWGADVVHAHLFGPDVLGALAAAGYLPVVTIHNAEPGWPPGTTALDGTRAALVLACARAVERSLRAAGVRAPLRTAYNGVEPAGDGAGLLAEAAERRRAWGAGAGALVVLVVANPRPQKRLDRVPGIAARLAATSARPVHVVWAGAAADTSEAARAIEAELLAGLRERRVPCHALGATLDLGPVYRACDVLLGTSAWEGLSLSHLEALAAGLPIVVTDVGGTGEIAAEARGHVTVLPPDATDEDFAAALARAVNGGDAPATASRSGEAPLRAVDAGDAPGPASRSAAALPPPFEVSAMVQCHARLLRRAARCALADSGSPTATRGSGDRSAVVLVTNNFSPGGAQSSARRLLLALAERGHRASAITLQEHASHPTPGTAALRAAGVDVVTLPPGVDPAAAMERAAEHIEEVRPAGVLLWNVIAEHKALLSDLLWDVRVFDVSPGEMYFRSLARYFERPRPDSAIRTPRSFGERLAGAVVKFEAERAQAAAVLGCAVHVIPNGVPRRERPRRRPGPGEPFRFGTAVRLHPDKRVDLLLDAFARLCAACPGVSLDVLGGPDSGCEAYSEALAREAAGLPVRWLGFSDDVGPFLDTLDAFVLVAEPAGCPNASLEALGAGLPVIATDVGGIREQLEGGAGIVVPRSDPAALAEAMEDVVRRPALAGTLATAGRARAAERFGLAVMAERYGRLLGLTPRDVAPGDAGGPPGGEVEGPPGP